MNRNLKSYKSYFAISIPVLVGLLAFFVMPQSSFFSEENRTPSLMEGKIIFSEIEFDFGEFHEGEKVGHRFEFVNKGDKEIRLTKVRASCGCTTPSYSKEPVQPGKKGFIDVVYNSENRPGPFEKRIFVENDGNPSLVTLTIKGKAVPAPLEGNDLSSQGGIMLSDGVIDMGNWDKKKAFRFTLRIQNTSDKPIKILSSDAPEYLKISYPPYSILPAEKINISLVLNAEKLKSGKFELPVKLQTNDKQVPDKYFEFRGVLFGKDQSSTLSPSIKFDETYIDLGTVVQGEFAHLQFAFVNEGDADLVIESIEPSCGCTVVDLKKKDTNRVSAIPCESNSTQTISLV